VIAAKALRLIAILRTGVPFFDARLFMADLQFKPYL
jgi:hypothetical protein